jgi:anti-sigma factor (TIGR02949 family)
MSERNCCEMLGQLSEYIDGELADELCRELERHIQSCSNCKIVYNTLQKTIDLYQQTGEQDVMPEDVRGRLYKRLELSEYLR